MEYKATNLILCPQNRIERYAMAFSLRKIISNITYFKTPEEEVGKSRDDIQRGSHRQSTQISGDNMEFINFERIEPDSTSKQCATSLKLPVSVKNFAAKKGSLSDTDLLTQNVENKNKEKRRLKKLKLDIVKANQSFDGNGDESDNVENTPKHVLLECRSSEVFSERLKKFDFNKSFNIFDSMSDDLSSYDDDDLDIESLSDTDISVEDDKANIQMCRKVGTESQSDEDSAPSATPESFGDVEVDKNEDERISLLLNYQLRIEKMDCLLKKLLSEFQFHIEVSKIFQSKSIITTLPGTNISHIPKLLGDVTYFENLRTISPSGSWNIIVEKEDHVTKNKIKKQLSSMKRAIDEFTKTYLKEEPQKYKVSKILSKNRKITLDVTRQKHARISNKKKIKHFDFPDLRDAFINLFADTDNVKNITNLESDTSKCHCNCHQSITDSGLTSKSEDQSVLITSSIGNFSLDSTTLSAYSESLDQIISYCSFQDMSLYSTLLQKPAIERITFYVQVHSIQLKCEPNNEYESKNVITFYCPACLTTETEENGLLRHILSQAHCEKLHFSYKTAYIKKCVEMGKEIQPSTVLNPMKMYRDDNKIVCFGDAMYACSLCFENLIVGESVLMAHCSDSDHIERREKLNEIFE